MALCGAISGGIMSRSGYSDDIDNWALIKWRGQVASAFRGARGQQMLRDILTAMDAMPVKELIANNVVCSDGVCAMGAAAASRGVDVTEIDPENYEAVASAMNIAPQMAQEIAYMNDEGTWGNETPSERFVRMRNWVSNQIKDAKP